MHCRADLSRTSANIVADCLAPWAPFVFRSLVTRPLCWPCALVLTEPSTFTSTGGSRYMATCSLLARAS